MAPRRCCVPSCTTIQGKGVPVHIFPNPSKPDEIERFRTWVMRIGGNIVGEDNMMIFKKRRICHQHFEERHTFPNQKLTNLAIPSLQIPGLQITSRRPMNQDVPGMSDIQAQAALEVPTAQPSTSGAQLAAPRTLIHGSKMRLRSKPMSKAERELRDTLASTRATLRRCQLSKNMFKTKLMLANKVMKTEAFQLAAKQMSPGARTAVNDYS